VLWRVLAVGIDEDFTSGSCIGYLPVAKRSRSSDSSNADVFSMVYREKRPPFPNVTSRSPAESQASARTHEQSHGLLHELAHGRPRGVSAG